MSAPPNATLVRAVVTWAQVAPERPTNATDPFDPAYRLDDLDELVRGAQQRGLEVLLSVWGTPRWANGGKTPNVMPTRLADLRDFSQALASRYSGRNAGYPFVRFWSVWNESNLQLFLTPQFDARRKIVGPRNYAKLYAAAYAGIKAGNPRALVGIGETSSHGRDRKLPGTSDTIAPGTFARLVAAANPRLKFDAWAHHPYPVPVRDEADAEGALAECRTELAASVRERRSTSGSSDAGSRSGSPSTGTRRGRPSRRG